MMCGRSRVAFAARGEQRLPAIALALLAAATMGAAAAPVAAQSPAAYADSLDTRLRDAEPFFTRSDAWLALGFAGGVLVMAPLDRQLAGELQDSTLQVHDGLRDVAAALRFLGFPGTAIIGTTMYGVGRVADLPRVAAFGLHGTEAVLLANVFVYAGKMLLGRARPELDNGNPWDFSLARGFRHPDYRSFPSGHTAAAFAVAAAVTAESREIWPEATPWIAPVLYSGALLVGISRMYHNRHWASDVVAGAAIGTFTGLKVIRYHYRNPANRVDDMLLPRAVVPDGDRLLLVWTVPLR